MTQGPNKFIWYELMTTDQDAAEAFYRAVVGWNMADAGQPQDALHHDNIPVSAWGFYINVDGIEAAAERIKANGGQVLMGPHEVPGGSWIVQAMDPQGAAFALVSTIR